MTELNVLINFKTEGKRVFCLVKMLIMEDMLAGAFSFTYGIKIF